jgi:hypothetical protein
VVEAQLEGTWFLGSNRADTEVCNIFTYADHLLIEILFSHPINILQIYELLSMGVFVMYIDGLCYLMC